MRHNQIIFITGTDTGVGKTFLTALLLQQFRRSGVHALAMKPFCSGGLGDVRLLQSLQRGELTDEEINPFYFSQPVAPIVALKQARKNIPLSQVVRRIEAINKRCEQLLVEGSGGLLVPLGAGYTVADLIAKLDCRVVIAARNQLGTINHTLLTVSALEAAGIDEKKITIVLMRQKKIDHSTATNAKVIAAWVKSIPVFSLPHLKTHILDQKSFPKSARKVISKLIQ